MVKERIETILKKGGVGVLATDTLYGLVGRALDKQAVERIYKLKQRKPDKPFIILIGNPQELEHFGKEVDPKLFKKYWPGPVSIILPCPYKEFEYLHRGTKTLAFRVPVKKTLRDSLRVTGPLVAPSANPESYAPAVTLAQAKEYFGEGVDFYKFGRGSGKASKLILIKDGKVEVLRR